MNKEVLLSLCSPEQTSITKIGDFLSQFSLFFFPEIRSERATAAETRTTNALAVLLVVSSVPALLAPRTAGPSTGTSLCAPSTAPVGAGAVATGASGIVVGVPSPPGGVSSPPW